MVFSLFVSGIVLTVYSKAHEPFHLNNQNKCDKCSDFLKREQESKKNSGIAGPVMLVCGVLMVYGVFRYHKWLAQAEQDMKDANQLEQRFKNMVTTSHSYSSPEKKQLNSKSSSSSNNVVPQAAFKITEIAPRASSISISPAPKDECSVNSSNPLSRNLADDITVKIANNYSTKLDDVNVSNVVVEITDAGNKVPAVLLTSQNF